MDDPEQDASANPDFALAQFLKAGSTSKALSWLNVLRGMLSGALRVGSRSAVTGAPVWATPEVLTGGFASGRLLAGGELLPREKERGGRAALNAYYASEPGRSELREMLATGRYRVDLPEEGALLALAWLHDHGRAGEAEALLAVLAPHFEELRFHPVPADSPLKESRSVQLQPLATTIRQLRATRVGVEYERQRETLRVWIPLLDRAVTLFGETEENGWPCRSYAPDWRVRARTLIADFKAAAAHAGCRRPKRKTENLPRLIGYLERCAADPKSLTGRDVGMIRHILRRIEAKRGLPGSERCRAVRALQAEQLKNPQPWQLAGPLADRLESLPPDAGSPSLEPPEPPLPEKLRAVVRRSMEAPLQTLLNEGVISSGEVLARVLPQMTGPLKAGRFEDPELRRLYAELYRSFRRRRSLLLLNFESQIKMHELPWVKALDAHAAAGAGHGPARELLAEAVAASLNAFPHVIFPNKLLQEFATLAEAAGLELPIVEETAADIFMGGFTAKYLHAAQAAGKLLGGTLYERYYGIPYRDILAIDDVEAAPDRAPLSRAYSELCRSRAEGRQAPDRWSVARNGKIIEQGLVLTTHNLAVFFDALGLASRLDTEALARRCFDWVCSKLESPPKAGRLSLVKNAAYAWRQMVFFLAVTPNPRLDWMSARLAARKPEFQKRFAPALDGFSREAPPFLGWTTGPHWALPPGEKARG